MAENNISQHDLFSYRENSYQSDDIITSIDIGSDKIICFIAKVDKILDKEKPRVVGYGYSQSKGMRNGAITNILELEKSIRRAVSEAENLAGVEVKNVSVNISGNYIKTERTFGELIIDGDIINQQHVVEVIDIAKKKFTPNNKKILHVIPSNFIVDNIKNISNPNGISANKLAVKLLFIYGKPTHINNLETIINNSHLKVINFTAKPYVSGLSTLTNEEKESGAVCIDIGSGSTSISIFVDGSIVFAKSINIGAWYISSDISKVLSTPFEQAEGLKNLYGSALRGPNDGDIIYQTPLMGGDLSEGSTLSRSKLISIIQPRFYEILMHAKKCIEQSGYFDVAKSNTVITGGGSELIGSAEFSERTLDSRVHIGRPLNINGLNEQISGPVFSSCAGMLIHSILSRKKEMDIQLKEPNFAYKFFQKIMGSGF